jgi:LacI family transcriptional regulator
MTTLQEVAKASGFSIKTVSRVINDEPNVAAHTRAAVLDAVRRLNYQPNYQARNLASGRTNAVGVVIHLSAREVFEYPLFNEILSGISEVLQAHRLDLLLRFADNDVRYTDLVLQKRVDGLILMSIPAGDPQIPALLESNAPCVFTCRVTDNPQQTHWVDSDFSEGIAQAVQHLADLGHTTIGLVAGPRALALSQLKREGYTRALERLGLEIRDELIRYGDLFTHDGDGTTRYFMNLENPPTAIIYNDDLQAVAGIQELTGMGRTIPDDVSVISVDDTRLARYTTPPLTSVHQDGYLKGKTAADALIRLLMHPDRKAQPAAQQLPVKLIIRGSTGPCPTTSRGRRSPPGERKE